MPRKKLNNYDTHELCEEIYNRMRAIAIKEEVVGIEEVIKFALCFHATSRLIAISALGSMHTISMLTKLIEETSAPSKIKLLQETILEIREEANLARIILNKNIENEGR